MKIIVVDDNAKFRNTLRLFVEQKLNHEVIAELPSGEDFLETNPETLLEADIILMDIIMGDVSGIDATKKIIWNYKNLKIIAITMHIEKVFLQQIVEAGFRGCVFKSDIFESLEKALNEVMAGRIYINDNIRLKNSHE